MKTSLYIALVLLLASSCKFANFTERPGVVKESFPKDMYGVYRHIEKSNGVRDTHILTIDSLGAHINDPLLDKIVNLKDSNNTLTHLGDYYYLNVKDTDSAGNFTYYVYPFEYDKKNLYIYKLFYDDKSNKRMLKSGLKLSGKRDGQYIMDNMPFKAYVEKYLKKKNAIHFKKIKS
ncbi:MAG: hypothetical protein JNM67_00720 [Bacteroidetes bacterium]|nr:hypothetical protein [Bacteroidota bacterium]